MTTTTTIEPGMYVTADRHRGVVWYVRRRATEEQVIEPDWAVYTGDEEQIVPFDTQVEHGRYHYVEEVAEEQEGSDEASV